MSNVQQVPIYTKNAALPPAAGHHRVVPVGVSIYGSTPPPPYEATVKQQAETIRRRSLVNIVAPPIDSGRIPKCCFFMNIRIGSFIIGFIELVLLAVALYGISHWFIDTSGDPESSGRRVGRVYRPQISRTGMLAGCLVAVFLSFFAILAMFYGLWKRRTNFILPHMVVQVFAILGSIAGVVLTSIAISVLKTTFVNDPDPDDDLSDKNSADTYYFCVGILVFCIFVFLFEIYAFLVVRNCARYYNDGGDSTVVVNEEMIERRESGGYHQ